MNDGQLDLIQCAEQVARAATALINGGQPGWLTWLEPAVKVLTALGALVGGGLAEVSGVRMTLLVASIGIISAAGWVIFSPVRYLLTQPEKDAVSA